jgi:hypothetical protein
MTKVKEGLDLKRMKGIILKYSKILKSFKMKRIKGNRVKMKKNQSKEKKEEK